MEDVSQFDNADNKRYIEFLKMYAAKHYGIDLMKINVETTQAWTSLSNEERKLYQIKKNVNNNEIKKKKKNQVKTMAALLFAAKHF